MAKRTIKRRSVKTIKHTTEEGKVTRNTKRKWYRKTTGPEGTVIGACKPDLREMFEK